MPEDHAALIERIVAWAEADDNIRALVMTGSAARNPDTVDRFSDRDIEIIARDPTLLATDDAWIHAIAPVWVSLPLGDPGGFARLVFFEGGRKVDFGVMDRSHMDRRIARRQLDDLYERGYRVLLDKDGLTTGLPEPTGGSPRHTLPSEAELADTVTEFWFEAAHMPTYLTRGDLWVVKFRDWTMKQMLLRMLEWHALATRGEETDVWHIGTKMKRWVDAETWDELQHVFGRFDRKDSWHALVAMMRLFSRLTHETATALDLDYPADSEEFITTYVLGFEDEIVSNAPDRYQ